MVSELWTPHHSDDEGIDNDDGWKRDKIVHSVDIDMHKEIKSRDWNQHFFIQIIWEKNRNGICKIIYALTNVYAQVSTHFAPNAMLKQIIK